MCHSSSRTGKDTPSHSEVSSASREAFAVQEPGKKAWKAKREPQLLQLSPGRAYALCLQSKAVAGLEKTESVNPLE